MKDFLEEYGARFDASNRVSDFGDWRAEFAAAQSSAVVMDLRDRDRLALTGTDAAKFLNRLLSFAMDSLEVGAGCRPFMLDSRGRIVLSFVCLRTADDRFVVDAAQGHGESVVSRIDMFHFGEDFASADISEETAIMTLAGPRALNILQALSLPTPDQVWGHANATIQGAQVRVVRSGRLGAPSFDLWTAPSDFAALWRRVTEAGASPAGRRTFDALRILGGTPTHPFEFGEHCTPLDSGGFDGLTDGKGCYPGQEVIERTIAMGRPALTLLPVGSDGDIPVGSRLMLADKDVGSVTSGATLPDGAWIGLALIKTRFKDTEAWQVNDSEVRPRSLES